MSKEYIELKDGDDGGDIFIRKNIITYITLNAMSGGSRVYLQDVEVPIRVKEAPHIVVGLIKEAEQAQ